MTLESHTIGNSCYVGDGTHSKIEREDSGVLYLTCRNFKDGRVDYSKVYYISEKNFTKYFKSGKKALICPQPGDLVFSIIGTIGEPYLVRDNDRFGISSSVAIVRSKQNIDPKFLYYWMRGSKFQGALFATKGGVAQGYVSLEMIKSLPAPSLPLTTQRKIAGILSAYDDLIENNLRRIKILEQMAQSLYREWFVHFRFPGHESAKFKESKLGRIPEGWEVKPMQEVAEVIDCLHSKKPEEDPVGTGILLQLFNIADGGKIDLTKLYRISAQDYARWADRIELTGGDCVITNVGRVAAVAQMPRGSKAALGRNMTGIRPNTQILSPTYLIEYLLSPYMESEVQQKKDAGAIMDSLNVRGIKILSVPIPLVHLMEKFESIARPLRRRIEILQLQNQTLRRTRDLLLPKLLTPITYNV